MAKRWELFIGCAPGLEGLLADEVEAVVGVAPEAAEGGVELVGDLETVAALNVRLGLATHVLVRLARFRAKHFSQLERGLREVDWSDWLSAPSGYSVRVHAKRSKLYHTKAIEERVRRVVQGAMPRSKPGTPQEVEPTLLVRIVSDECEVSIDSSGEPLHRRGYRLASAKAPLREDLARAVVLLSGWDRATTLFDPFCGSGTLGIEAALWARDIAPGRARRFAFEAWPGCPPGVTERVRAAAAARERSTAPGSVWLSDRDAGAVKSASENAERAGVSGSIRVEEAPMGRATLFDRAPEAGTWVSNPPHGRRIGDVAGLRKLHQSLGRRFESLGAGWGLTLVVRDKRLARSTGVSLESKVMTSSGGSKIWVLGHAPER